MTNTIPKTAVEIVRSRAARAASHGSHDFAAYLNSMADKGEEAAQREIDATREIGRRIVEQVESDDAKPEARI